MEDAPTTIPTFLTVPAPPKPAKAPAHLRAATRRFWADITAEYDLDPHHLKLLESACRALDTAQAADAEVRKRGHFVLDRYSQPKVNPAVRVAHEARTSFTATIKALDLDAEPAPDARYARRHA